MENKTNNEKEKKTSTRMHQRHLVPGISPNTLWYSVWLSKKHRGSAPQGCRRRPLRSREEERNY